MQRHDTSRLLVSRGSLVLIGGLAVVSGCGDGSDDTATATTVTVADSSYVSKPPATMATIATTIPLADAEPGERVEQWQEYTIREGDYPLKISEMYGVELEALMNMNEWEDESDFPYAGATIRIPPGGIVPQAEPGGEAPPTTPLAGAEFVITVPAPASPSGDGDSDTAGVGVAGRLTDDCGEGTYTIESGDYPIGVAEKFDVDVQALEAANAGTPGYSAFYPGLEIVIPAKSGC